MSTPATHSPRPPRPAEVVADKIDAAQVLLDLLEDPANAYALRDLLSRLKGEERQVRRAGLTVLDGGGEGVEPGRNRLPRLSERDAVKAGTLARPTYLRVVPDRDADE